MLGSAGDDEMVWKDGDGTDRMEGLAGTDATEVNGANAAGDAFAINRDGQRVRFEHTNLEPFRLDIGTTETPEMNGGGGDDTIAGTAGLAPHIKLRMNGGEGNDTLIGSDGDHVMDAGPGDDTMVCGAGHDVMAGNDGDNRTVWNHDDGSDVMSGTAFEPIIGPTCDALGEFSPDFLVPAHCTGWWAAHALAARFTKAFIQNSVGTRFEFAAADA